MGGGQFCTNAGFVLLFADARTDQFIDEVKSAFDAAQPPALLSEGVAKGLADSVKTLRSAGADLLTAPGAGATGARHPNTLLRVTGEQFLAEPEKLQTEAFGSASLCVVVRDVDEAEAVLSHLEGNLTGCIYSDTQGSDEGLYARLAPALAPAGRPSAERQDADGRCREPGDESRRAVSRRPAIPALPRSAFRRRCAASACCAATTTSASTGCPPRCAIENPNGRMWRLIDGTMTQDSCS